MRLTRDQVREVDRLAIEELGIPGIVLMENAARNAAAEALTMMPAGGRATILCGGGNNGGDGYAMARLLHNAGRQVTIFAARDPASLTGDAAINAAIARQMGLIFTDTPDLHDADILIDALLGTGFGGEVRQPLAGLIEAINAAGRPVLAVDVPSGLDCDTGKPAAATVRADVTVTFVAEKVGFAAPTAGPYLGRVVVADIGAPASLIDRVLRH